MPLRTSRVLDKRCLPALVGLVLTGFPIGGLARAQSMAAAPMSAMDTAASKPHPLFTTRDAVVALGFGAATVASFPLDERIARRLEDSTTQANRFFHHSATDFEDMALPGAYVIGGALYAVGRIAHLDRLADLGLHGTEAVALADATGALLKGLAGRSRPFVTADSNAHDFRFGGGFTRDSRTSLPSLHSATAFAAAAAVTAETGRWWPQSTIIVGPVMYAGATMVGLSRMYHNKHWASDVALGAAIGTFSGQKVVQYAHAHPSSLLNRTLAATSLSTDGRGRARIGWSLDR